METQQKNKRKALLMLPLLVLPLLALAFYALGGGRADIQAQAIARGINPNLPDADFKKEEPKDKLGIYQQTGGVSPEDSNAIASVASRLGFNGLEKEDPQTKAINDKLQALNQEIARPTETASHSYPAKPRNAPTGMKSDVDRLEALMKAMQENKTEDPEIRQLNGMLQNILDIQHPERVGQRAKYVKSTDSGEQFKAIPAVIADNQKAVQGATVRLRLQDSALISGQIIPKGQYLFGTCRITNQRLLLDIQNIRLGTSIVPVDLTVYSLDGMEGINAPEALLTDAVNTGTGDAIGSIGMYGVDNSIATQVAGAGIEAAKGLLSKKVRRIKVKLTAGQQVLIRNNDIRKR